MPTLTFRSVPVPALCPQCGAPDLASCLDAGHCPANRIANLTPEDIGWAMKEIARIETQR